MEWRFSRGTDTGVADVTVREGWRVETLEKVEVSRGRSRYVEEGRRRSKKDEEFRSDRAFEGGTNEGEGHTTVAFVTGTVSVVRNSLVSHHYVSVEGQLSDIFGNSSLHLSTRIVENHTHTPLTFVTKRLASREHTPPSRM